LCGGPDRRRPGQSLFVEAAGQPEQHIDAASAGHVLDALWIDQERANSGRAGARREIGTGGETPARNGRSTTGELRARQPPAPVV
jgi:hypothetical protein